MRREEQDEKRGAAMRSVIEGTLKILLRDEHP